MGEKICFSNCCNFSNFGLIKNLKIFGRRKHILYKKNFGFILYFKNMKSYSDLLAGSAFWPGPPISKTYRICADFMKIYKIMCNFPNFDRI